jgi:hypothetical protein
MQVKLLLGLLACGIGVAQTDPPLRLGPFHNLQKQGSIQALVELPITSAVQANEFQLLEDGRRTSRASSLVAFAASGWKTALVLALDISHSIKPAELDQAKQACVQLVANIKVPVALITFADTADTAAGFDASHDQLTAAISKLKPVGQNTRLYDALDKALGLLEDRARPERQRIIVISDGDEDSQAGADSLDGVLSRAEKRLVPIDTIWVPTAAEGARNTLVRASERTEGFYADAKQSPEILAALNQILDRIDKSIVLTFDRKLDSSGQMTKEVGIAADHAGISSASIPLVIAASAPKGSWLDWFGSLVTFLTNVKALLSLFGGLAGTYGAYTAYFLLVKKYYPAVVPKLPFNPIHFRPTTVQNSDVTPPPTEPQPANGGSPEVKKRRVTVVEHGGEPARGRGLVLHAVKGPLAGQRISIERAHFKIGADPDNDLAIASDDFVSGRHAIIQAANGEWLLVDQGSRNGTFLDGRRVERGPGQILRRGQSIQLGSSEFRVILEDAKVVHASSMPVR